MEWKKGRGRWGGGGEGVRMKQLGGSIWHWLMSTRTPSCEWFYKEVVQSLTPKWILEKCNAERVQATDWSNLILVKVVAFSLEKWQQLRNQWEIAMYNGQCSICNDQYTVDWATNKCTGHWAMCNGQLKGGGWTNKAFKGCDGANLSLAKFVGYLWKGSRARGKFELGLQAQKLGVHEKEMSPLVFLQHGGRFNLRKYVLCNHL